MRLLFCNNLFLLFIFWFKYTCANSTYRHHSSSSSTYSSSSTITHGSSSGGWHPQRPGINTEQVEQQSIDFDNYDQRGQEIQQQPNEWDDLDQIQQKPNKGSPPVRPSIAHLHATSKGFICSEAIKSLNGLIRGKHVKTSTGKDICEFLGIPFAKPPIGELRFKRPVPAVNWEGTYDAIKIPNACKQTLYATHLFPMPKTINVSEDCLYLNIWVPISVIKNKTLDTSTSVMVWIHGGGFAMGSSTMYSDDAPILSSEQNVIVVSIQYRLGPLGFLYFGVEDAPGNVGLLDQNLALQWINANIQQFGGNKNEITLFGESAGSMSISHHLLSPLSRNLFKRGIMMSGVSISPICFRSKSEAIDFSYEVGESLGCWNPKEQGNLKKSVGDVIKCMKNIDSTLINQFPFQAKKFVDPPSSVTIDDYMITDTPANLLNGIENTRADLIIGVVQDEGSLALLLDYTKYFSGFANPTISYDTFITLLRGIFRDRPIFEQNAIISHYTNWKNLDDSDENLKRIIAVASDYMFVCPAIEFANKWSAKGLNVYFYWFTQRPLNDLMPKWTGVTHMSDIEYIFGGPLTKSNRPKNEQDLSKNIQQLFTNFAKTGIPSKNWSTYTSAYPVFLDLNATLISDQTTNNIFGPHATDCRFWNYELPLLREYHASGLSCTADHESISSSCNNNKQEESHRMKENLVSKKCKCKENVPSADSIKDSITSCM